MKFTPSPIAGGLSGSAGSLVASRNRFGPYFRVKAIPVNPNTTRQQVVRSIFSGLVNAWINELDNAERTAWTTYADNVPINGEILTGQNHYIRTNSPRIQIGETRIDAAPTIFDTGAPVSSIELVTDSTPNVYGLNAAGLALAILANVTGSTSEDGDLIFYNAAPINVTRGFYKGPYQLAFSFSVAAALSQIPLITLLADYLSANGTPTDGENRGLRMRILYDDGRLSDVFELLSIVTLDSV